MRPSTPTLGSLATKVQLRALGMRLTKLNPRWIRNNLGYGIYERITEFLKKKRNGAFDWEPFKKLLLPELQRIWLVRIVKPLTFEQCVRNVRKVLTKNNPLVFNASYLEQHCPYEYDRLRHVFLKKAERGWCSQSLLNMLGSKWEKRWKPVFERK